MNVPKKNLKRFLVKNFGIDIVRVGATSSARVVEFNSAEREILDFILRSGMTMVSRERLINTMLACKYVVNSNLMGEFVECGVWRGGNSIAAAKVFELYKEVRTVRLFDTFTGMSEPAEFDFENSFQEDRENALKKTQRVFLNSLRNDNVSTWCYASLEEVTSNFLRAGVSLSNVKFIRGRVEDTLLDDRNIPESISVLRLDTDWYESTKLELDVLWPRLAKGGVLLLDDYGHWNGAKKAVDEFFQDSRPFFSYTDYTGRVAIKQ
jgi:hypothetical protein